MFSISLGFFLSCLYHFIHSSFTGLSFFAVFWKWKEFSPFFFFPQIYTHWTRHFPLSTALTEFCFDVLCLHWQATWLPLLFLSDIFSLTWFKGLWLDFQATGVFQLYLCFCFQLNSTVAREHSPLISSLCGHAGEHHVLMRRTGTRPLSDQWSARLSVRQTRHLYCSELPYLFWFFFFCFCLLSKSSIKRGG